MDNKKPKTEQERAEDIVYTINHAIACTVSDISSPFIGNWTQKYLGKRFEPGCSHDHGHDHAHDHSHEPHMHSHAQPQAGFLKHYWIGEAVGDFAAVPITIAFQRYAPALMGILRKIMEPVLGPLFRMGAKRAANRWALENAIAPDDFTVKEKQEQLYHYEIEHLPQAFVWTATSTLLNVATQKFTGNKGPLWQIFAGKLSGTAFSAALVVGARTVFPGAAQQWENKVAQNVILPTTKAVSGLFGIDAKKPAVDHSRWEDRMADRGASPALSRER